jgi:hypothetical protein
MSKHKPQYIIYYSGGAGGFMFYYSFLIALGYDVSDLIKQNWKIDEYSSWKKSETKKIFDNVRLYGNREILDRSVTSILLYTDIKTQEALARLKCAKWYAEFQDKGIPKDYKFENVLMSYNNVKDPEWPVITSYEDLDALPVEIRTELVETYNFPESMSDPFAWVIRLYYEQSFTYNGIKICDDNESLLDADYKFLLQDVVDTKFKCVCDEMNLPYTQEIAKHVDDWVAMHPENIQKMLHNDI